MVAPFLGIDFASLAMHCHAAKGQQSSTSSSKPAQEFPHQKSEIARVRLFLRVLQKNPIFFLLNLCLIVCTRTPVIVFWA